MDVSPCREKNPYSLIFVGYSRSGHETQLFVVGFHVLTSCLHQPLMLIQFDGEYIPVVVVVLVLSGITYGSGIIGSTAWLHRRWSQSTDSGWIIIDFIEHGYSALFTFACDTT